jgi:hypothetical protein
MIDADYWFDEAEKYKERAAEAEDPAEREEYLELCDICFDVATSLEDRVTGG